MITFLSHRIALFLRDNDIVDDETAQVCQYGFEIIISTFFGFLLVVSIGVCCGEIISALLFYVLFVGVRLSTGGYHASTYFRCKLLLCFCCLFTVLITKVYISKYSLWIQSVILVFYLGTVLLFSPIEHKNAPLNDASLKRNRLISLVVSFILAPVIMLGYYEFKKISMISVMTLLVIAFLMLLSKISERRNEK
jgi:accessory gene regulator B